MRARIWLSLLAICLVLAPVGARAERVLVFAAASLKTALDGVVPLAEDAGITLVPVYAGSSALARQIIAGAPADLYISASPDWVTAVAQAGRVVPGSRVDLLGNRLALVSATPRPPVEITPGLDIAALLGDGRLAMALVDAVPAGRYGQAALRSLGQWEALAPRLAQADNVRAALALVATGAAPLGIVYATDAAAEPRVTPLGLFPEDGHPPIVLPMALISDRPGARALHTLLQGAAAREVFAAQGFRVLGGSE